MRYNKINSILNLFNTILSFVLLLIHFASLNAKTYFVNSTFGNDENSGIVKSAPWKSIVKINDYSFLPGDSILFSKNCIWREELRIASNGSLDKPIVIGSYGKGKEPKIMGSQLIGNWVKLNSNLWESQFDATIGCLWFVNQQSVINWGIKKTDLQHLISNFDYFVTSESIIIYSEVNPNRSELSIEASVRDFGIITGWYEKAKNHIIIENLEVLFTINANIRAVGSKGFIVKNCILHHSGNTDETDGQGIQYEGEDGLFSGNLLFENGQHGIYISAFGNAPVNNIIIEKNRVYNNYHTGIDIMNLGGGVKGLKNIIIRYNYVFDTENHNGKEIGIQLLAYAPGKITNSDIYYNIVRGVKGIAFAIFPETDSIKLLNNTAFKPESACFLIDGDSANITCFNNIGVADEYYCIISIEHKTNKLVNNNFWYRKSGIIASIGENDYRNWRDYVIETGFDTEGFNLDPLFEDVSKFNLQERSKCINGGLDVGLQYDFLGNTIIGKPDIGAVEFFE